MESGSADGYHAGASASRTQLGRHESEEARTDVCIAEPQSLSRVRASLLFVGGYSPAMRRISGGCEAAEKGQTEEAGQGSDPGRDSLRVAQAVSQVRYTRACSQGDVRVRSQVHHAENEVRRRQRELIFDFRFSIFDF